MRDDLLERQLVLETERFTLRPVKTSDAGLLELYLADERVAKATSNIPHPLPPGSTGALLSRAQSDQGNEDIWIMDGSKTGHAEVLGIIALERMGREQSEVSYWVAPAFWNTGLASEAVNTLLSANPQNSATIFAQVFQDNPASARVLTKAGFKYLGDAETHSVARGANVPTWTYLRKYSDTPKA